MISQPHKPPLVSLCGSGKLAELDDDEFLTHDGTV
jgi:hypothetical protein